jgi:hypothetical protein
MDTNEDGVITLDEFKALLVQQQGSSPAMDDETANAILQTIKDCGFDKNGDGKLQIEECAHPRHESTHTTTTTNNILAIALTEIVWIFSLSQIGLCLCCTAGMKKDGSGKARRSTALGVAA